MKPRIIKIRGVWHCGIKGAPRGQWYGLGMSPYWAYMDWRGQNHG